jgi:hypothetical protein
MVVMSVKNSAAVDARPPYRDRRGVLNEILMSVHELARQAPKFHTEQIQSASVHGAQTGSGNSGLAGWRQGWK